MDDGFRFRCVVVALNASLWSMCAQRPLSFHPMPKVYRCNGPRPMTDRIERRGLDDMLTSHTVPTEHQWLSSWKIDGCLWPEYRRTLPSNVLEEPTAQESLIYFSRTQLRCPKDTTWTADSIRNTAVLRSFSRRPRTFLSRWRIEEVKIILTDFQKRFLDVNYMCQTVEKQVALGDFKGTLVIFWNYANLDQISHCAVFQIG